MVQLCDGTKNLTVVCQKVARIVYGLWKIQGLFGHTAAVAWVYYGASIVFYSEESPQNIVEEIPRARAEAPKPLLLE